MTVTLEDLLHDELDEFERMRDEEIALPFGPIQCQSCHAPIREASGGRWFGGYPYCLPCVREGR